MGHQAGGGGVEGKMPAPASFGYPAEIPGFCTEGPLLGPRGTLLSSKPH